MTNDLWYDVEGEVVGWLSQTNDGGIGRETMVVRVLKLDGERPDIMFLLRWVGNDYELSKFREYPREMADEVEVGDTVRFTTNSSEQDNYAVA